MLTCTINDETEILARGSKRRSSTSRLIPQEPTKYEGFVLAPKPPNKILGMRGSDIDKYSRVIFPILFISFHMVYWMIYLTISGEIPSDLVYLK